MYKRERRAYLEQPVAPAVEGGDDGGVDVAAIQTLQGGRHKTHSMLPTPYCTVRYHTDFPLTRIPYPFPRDEHSWSGQMARLLSFEAVTWRRRPGWLTPVAVERSGYQDPSSSSLCLCPSLNTDLNVPHSPPQPPTPSPWSLEGPPDRMIQVFRTPPPFLPPPRGAQCGA